MTKSAMTKFTVPENLFLLLVEHVPREDNTDVEGIAGETQQRDAGSVRSLNSMFAWPTKSFEIGCLSATVETHLVQKLSRVPSLDSLMLDATNTKPMRRPTNKVKSQTG